MTITLPKGYRPPEQARPGEPFEVVAVLVSDKDGTFTLKSLDGVELEEPEEEEEEAPFTMPWDEPEPLSEA